MSSETSLLNNRASPVLGYDLEVALNRLKIDLDQTELKNMINNLSNLVNNMSSTISDLSNSVNNMSSSISDLDDRVTALEGREEENSIKNEIKDIIKEEEIKMRLMIAANFEDKNNFENFLNYYMLEDVVNGYISDYVKKINYDENIGSFQLNKIDNYGFLTDYFDELVEVKNLFNDTLSFKELHNIRKDLRAFYQIGYFDYGDNEQTNKNSFIAYLNSLETYKTQNNSDLSLYSLHFYSVPFMRLNLNYVSVVSFAFNFYAEVNRNLASPKDNNELREFLYNYINGNIKNLSDFHDLTVADVVQYIN